MKSEKTIVIASTFTADPITESLQFWLERLQMTCRVILAPPFQILQALLDPASLLRSNVAGLNVVLARWADLTYRDYNAAGATSPAEELAAALRCSVKENRVHHLVILCSSKPSSEGSNQERLHKDWDNRLLGEFDSHPNVSILTTEDIQSLYKVIHAHDSYGDGLAAIPYTPAMLAALGTIIARKCHMLTQPPHKVIAVDCDNTLWTGICAEDGPEGIILDPSRLILQKHLLDQYQKGALLCLCSKNNAEDVLAVFHGRKEMPLNLRHFISQRINWEPKSESIMSLARELGVSVDSFVFLDDDPVECEAMRTCLPEVLTLQLPAATTDIPEFLGHIWAFDRPKRTTEDQHRTVLYVQDRERENLRKKVTTIEDFLAGLNLKLDFQCLDESQLARASQLTMRVNQFNLTTIRRTEAELATLMKQRDFSGLLIHASDRFGDYGIIGLILLRWRFDMLLVDTFLLSCRALGRGVEHLAVTELAALAQNKGLNTVVLRLTVTSKNQPAKNFLDSEFAAYSRRDKESWVYPVPVEIAQNVRPRVNVPTHPVTEVPPGLTHAPKFETSRSRDDRSFQLAGLTTALTEADKILSHIQNWKRNARLTSELETLAPNTEIEQTLAKIWAEILGWEKVGIRDNFLTLGGDSLKMVQVVVRIYGQLGVELPISTFFETPTIEAQALILAQRLGIKKDLEGSST